MMNIPSKLWITKNFQLGLEEKTSLKKKINLAVVGFGIVFAIFSTGLIVYGWFIDPHHEPPCAKIVNSVDHVLQEAA